MNRKTLLAFLRKHLKYTGPANLDKVVEFLESEGYDAEALDIVDAKNPSESKRVDAKKAWNIVPKLTLAGEGDGEPTGDGKKAKPSRGGTATATLEGSDGDDDEDGEGDGEESISSLRSQFKAFREQVRLSGGLSIAAAVDAAAGESGKGPEFSAKAFQRQAQRKHYQRQIVAGKSRYDDAEVAEVVTAYQRIKFARLMETDYSDRKYDEAICKAAQVEFDNTLGGALVPIEFSNYYQKIREKYGVVRSWFRVVSMSRDVQEFPRRGLGTAAGVTVSKAGEGGAITASTVTVNKIKLTAQKMTTLVQVSNEVMNDSAISVADLVADEIGWAFAQKEDDCFINGDGSSTYLGFQGILNAIKSLSGTVANIAGVYQTSANAWSSVALTDFHQVEALFPDLETGTEPSWYCNRRFKANVMNKLMYAGGGNTVETIGGKPTATFNGDPVNTGRVMPRVYAAAQIVALYGDATRAATIGVVNGSMRIDQSSDRYFDQDLFAFRGVERVAFNPHDIGDANATEASRNPGPLVALMTT